MRSIRIIPCLDIDQGRVVKGVRFVDLIDAGDPVEQAIYYMQEFADELMFLDITASSDKRKIVIDLVKKIARDLFIPFAVGGGVRSVNDIYQVLHHGADKVSINTAGFLNPSLFEEAAKRFGSQCLVCAIDAKWNPTGKYYEVYLKGGREPTGADAIRWAREAYQRGAGEILLTSMDRDGTQNGFDLQLTKRVIDAVPIPVIASGGIGSIDHFIEGAEIGATGLLAASVFHFRQLTIKQVKEALNQKGFAVRIDHR